MPIERERPYSQFNFKVLIGAIEAGFQECSGFGLEITVAEYRNGNYPLNSPQKITGVHKVPDVTLKRGVMGEVALLHQWIQNVRDGDQNDRRTVTIQLQDEAHNGPVQQWILSEARPIKFVGGSLTAKGTDVLIEEFTLACEGIECTEG